MLKGLKSRLPNETRIIYSLLVKEKPDAPKIICAANNPEKGQTYGAVISLFVFRMLRAILHKGRNKSSIIIDELPSIFLNGIEQFIAVARSYLVSTILYVCRILAS